MMMEIPDASAGSAINTASQRRRLALVLIGLVTIPSYTAVFPVFGTRIREYFDISAEQYGTLMGLSSFGRIPSLIFIGLLIASLGTRRIVTLAVVGTGASFLVIGMGGKLSTFQAGMVAIGLFTAMGGVAIPALMIALYPALKRRMFSVQLVASAAPAILFPFLAQQMLVWSASRGDRAFADVLFVPFIIAGAVLLAGGGLLAVRRQTEVRVELETPSAIKPRELLNYRTFLIVLMIALHGAADNTVYQFLPQFMETHFQRLPLSTAWAVAGHALAYVLTRSFLCVLPERFGQRAILTLAGPIGGLTVIGTLWFGTPTMVPVFYTIACLFFAAEYPVLVSEISSQSTGNFGSVLAAGLLASELVTFALLKSTGRLADQTGDFRVALSVAACGFIAFGVIAAFAGFGKSASASNGKTDG
jgi:MFS family permease